MVYDLEILPKPMDDLEPLEMKATHQPGASVFTQSRLVMGDELFDVLRTTDRSQMAVMALQNGQTSGPFGTDHPDADQTFYVIEGTGQLVLEGRDIEVHPGDCGVIEAGTRHQFIGKGEHVFRTFNAYAPVAYPEEKRA
jgi:mannose-6-phosphate isomerase-like protein (cupin superfamily)